MATMDEYEACLARWPVVNDRPALLRATCVGGPSTRERANTALRKSLKTSPPSEVEAHALLAATRAYPLPPLGPHDDPAETAPYELSRHVSYPSLVPAIVETLAMPRPTVQRSLLALLVHIGTRDAADAFATFLEAGLPEGVRLYGAAHEEIARFVPHGDRVFPALFAHAPEEARRLVPTIEKAFVERRLSVAARDALEAPIATLLEAATQRARRAQRAEGSAWRWNDDYRHQVRARLEELCALARFLAGPRSADALRAATELRDPALAIAALAALLARREPIDETVIARLAASHEARRPLFESLDAAGRLALFPREWRTPDAFAAADLVEHVIKSDIGEEPSSIVLEDVLWRWCGRFYVFRIETPEGELAGISGPARLFSRDRPYRGLATAIDAMPFEAATPGEHLDRLLRG